MQQGSLVTPRWNKGQMIQEILSRWPAMVLVIQSLPEFGQIYTVKFAGLHCEKCNRVHIVVEELVVIPATCVDSGVEYGLPADFYIEVDPPQENVQQVVEDIQLETVVWM